MKTLWCLLVCVGLTANGFMFSSKAQAESEQKNIDQLDLEQLTCRELLKSGGEERSNIIIFLHGYMSGKNDETLVDGPELAAITEEIADACIDDPEGTALSVFEEFR